MARGRFISESVAKDLRLNSLSVEAELVYLMTIPHLDRDGLIEGDTDILHGTVCPKRRQFLDCIDTLINEWVEVGLVTKYDSVEGPVLWFRGFAKNQIGLRYDREVVSKFPPPPGYRHSKAGLVTVDTPSPSSDDADSVRQSAGGVPQDDGGSRNLSAQVEVKDQVEDQQKQEDDEEDTRAREPIAQAWHDYYGVEVPDNFKERLEKLEIECGSEAVIHGISASIRANTRTFRYIAECAHNYVPPPEDGYVNGAGYHVELPAQEVDFMPGVHPMTPTANPQPPPPLPPPMSHDDPWAVALAELSPTLVGVAASWLVGSQMEESGELAGVPLYRVIVTNGAANMVWLTQQAEPAIRKKLSSLFGKRVLVEIVAATVHGEPA